MSGIDCSFREVKDGRYVHHHPTWPSLDGLGRLEDDKHAVVDEYIRSIEAETKARYDRLDSKLKSLLAANGIAFGLISGLSLLAKPLLLTVVAPLLFSALVSLRALGVHNFQTLSLTRDEVEHDIRTLRATLVLGRLAALNANACVLDFVVDCLRSAHRFFILGLVLVPVTYLIGLRSPNRPPEVRVQLEATQQLRGPQGPVGPQGSVGPPGPRDRLAPLEATVHHPRREPRHPFGTGTRSLDRKVSLRGVVARHTTSPNAGGLGGLSADSSAVDAREFRREC